MTASKAIVRMLAAASATFGLTASAFGQATFQGLGDLDGGDFLSQAFAVSADGTVVVGESSSALGEREAFRWTEAGGMIGLSDLDGGRFQSSARATSADGLVVVGSGETASGSEAFRWTAGGGMVGLGGGFSFSEGLDTSDDGMVVVGTGRTFGDVAFRWTEAGGTLVLPDLPGGRFGSIAWATSPDGAVVVGQSGSASGEEAFRWTSGGGMVGLDDLPGGNFFSTARATSADGAVVVGRSFSASGMEAFRWTQAGGMVGLGDLRGEFFSSRAHATSADGTVVVGAGRSGFGPFAVFSEAFIWMPGRRMRSLQETLSTAFGLDLPGWQLLDARGISADGMTIVGFGTNPDGFREAWIVTGALVDSDMDGAPDVFDICPGSDDNGPDSDIDGVPDACDVCDGLDDTIDLDFDGIPDCQALCFGSGGDCNLNGIPDDCEVAGETVTEIITASGDLMGNGLDLPWAIAADAAGNVYVAGRNSHNVFKITPAGSITEIIGSDGDGLGNVLTSPLGVAVDTIGNVYVTGVSSSNVFKITFEPEPVITKIADVANPSAIAVDSTTGDVYVASNVSSSVFKITPTGGITEIITVTGDGQGNILLSPDGIAVDTDGNVYVAGGSSDNVFKIASTNGAITQIIGPDGDGQGNTLVLPIGIGVDADGNVYVAGHNSDNAFKITPGGVITEIIDANGDGMGIGLVQTRGIAVDTAGNAYVAGQLTDNAFKITPEGVITEIITAAGEPLGIGLDTPIDIAVDAAGNVYIASTINHNAFKIVPRASDCNLNGIPDECDIDQGTSLDLNGDGVPDECDPLADPDADGILNEVDLDDFVASTQFSDASLGGVTTGTLVPATDKTTVRDITPGGVQLTTTTDEVAIVFDCTLVAPTSLPFSGTQNPDTVAEYTCGSLTIDVLVGSTVVEFTTSDGVTHDVIVTEGGGVTLLETVDETTGELEVMTIVATGTQATVIVDGQVSTGGSTVVGTNLSGLVGIDIKPGSSPNSINLGSNGSVPVAIFSTATFDATLIDPTSVFLADSAVNLRGNGTPQVSFRDLNGDGLTDLLVHIDTQAFELSEEDTLAFLIALADVNGDGVADEIVSGVDTIRVVP